MEVILAMGLERRGLAGPHLLPEDREVTQGAEPLLQALAVAGVVVRAPASVVEVVAVAVAVVVAVCLVMVAPVLPVLPVLQQLTILFLLQVVRPTP